MSLSWSDAPPHPLRRRATATSPILRTDPDLTDRLALDDHERTWRRLHRPDVVAWVVRWPVGTSTGWHDTSASTAAYAARSSSSTAC